MGVTDAVLKDGTYTLLYGGKADVPEKCLQITNHYLQKNGNSIANCGAVSSFAITRSITTHLYKISQGEKCLRAADDKFHDKCAVNDGFDWHIALNGAEYGVVVDKGNKCLISNNNGQHKHLSKFKWGYGDQYLCGLPTYKTHYQSKIHFKNFKPLTGRVRKRSSH